MRHLYVTNPEWNSSGSILALINVNTKGKYHKNPSPDYDFFVVFVDTNTQQTRNLIYSTPVDRAWPTADTQT